MANVKITGLDALAEAPNGADLVEIVDDVAGTPTSKKITIANLMANTVSSYNSTGVTLTNTTTDNTISVDQNGDVGTAVATDGAVHIENTGNTGIGLGVYTNIGATADAALIVAHADNVAFDQNVVSLVNDGTATCLNIAQNGDSIAIGITSAATTARALNIYNNAANTSSTGFVRFTLDSATATANLLVLQQDGTGHGLYVDQNGTGTNNAILIDMDGNNAARIFGMSITVDNVGAGNLVGGIDFSGMSDGEPLLKLTSTDTDLSTKSPETDAESGWFPVIVGTTVYAVPIYALS